MSRFCQPVLLIHHALPHPDPDFLSSGASVLVLGPKLPEFHRREIMALKAHNLRMCSPCAGARNHKNGKRGFRIRKNPISHTPDTGVSSQEIPIVLVRAGSCSLYRADGFATYNFGYSDVICLGISVSLFPRKNASTEGHRRGEVSEASRCERQAAGD